MSRMLVVADDLTGAVDVAAAFQNAKPDSHCVVSTWTNDCEINWSAINDELHPDLICINTDSRNTSEHEARARVKRAINWSGKTNFRLMKKVDSLLRGNVHAEIDEFLGNKNLGTRPVLFAPALPSLERTTLGGIQRANGIPVSISEAAADPLAPTLESDLRKLIPSDRLAVLTPLDQVRSNLFSSTLKSFSTMNTVFIPDVENQLDLENVFTAASDVDDMIFIGSSGLLTSSQSIIRDNYLDVEADLLIVSLSLRSETSAQFQSFVENNPGTQIVDITNSRQQSYQDIGNQVINSLDINKNVILKLSVNNQVAADPSERELAAQLLLDRSARAIVEIIGQRSNPMILVLLGGDISQKFCQLASIRFLTVVGTVCQGGAICNLPEDLKYPDLTLIVRSGGFGDKNSLLELRPFSNVEISRRGSKK